MAANFAKLPDLLHRRKPAGAAPIRRCALYGHEPREVLLSGRDPKLGSSSIVAVDHAAGLAVFTLTIDPIVGAVVCCGLKDLVDKSSICACFANR